MKAPITVVVICLLACSLLLGQVVSSSIRGALVDPTGAAIPGAQCTLTNQTTGAVLKATSSADGSFVFPNVLPGTYTLKIEATGFKTLETKDIVVTAN